MLKPGFYVICPHCDGASCKDCGANKLPGYWFAPNIGQSEKCARMKVSRYCKIEDPNTLACYVCPDCVSLVLVYAPPHARAYLSTSFKPIQHKAQVNPVPPKPELSKTLTGNALRDDIFRKIFNS